ncbi:helix-turn-helix transcriptional regulator [Paenibacillus sp.]|uniref:helix-turn-helix domain-containing protein n=1 Tax=Paenibacillus sp. TaxID=58172 RepID=UPI002D4FB98A|nr:helix-turn-helix transcriptional regulator [Paenibacillus sp.]HZG87148.1 helix-turn-helix transcriptional regulator [Paenibacillus sp.]
MQNAKKGGASVESVLKHTRERAGMSLEHAARRLRISPGYLLQIENGARGVGIPRAAQIAELYALDRDELFVPIRFAARFCKGGRT